MDVPSLVGTVACVLLTDLFVKCGLHYIHKLISTGLPSHKTSFLFLCK